jgi:hypothetical protein
LFLGGAAAINAVVVFAALEFAEKLGSYQGIALAIPQLV